MIIVYTHTVASPEDRNPTDASGADSLQRVIPCHGQRLDPTLGMRPGEAKRLHYRFFQEYVRFRSLTPYCRFVLAVADFPGSVPPRIPLNS